MNNKLQMSHAPFFLLNINVPNFQLGYWLDYQSIREKMLYH
jgi:hypothetical protein